MAFITEWNMPAGNFTLPLRSGKSYNMVVDWGDGSPTSAVTAYDDAAATHNYAAPGTYQISITGTCTSWYMYGSAHKEQLTKVVEWGDVGFYSMDYGFYGCSNLSYLATDGIFKNSGGGTLKFMFYNCTSLTTIPGNLFQNFNSFSSGACAYIFSGCENLTAIPAGLFDSATNIGYEAFKQTFYRCYSLTTIPADLFKYNTKASTSAFNGTFMDCRALTTIPADLFRYNVTTAYYSFYETFRGCDALQTLPVDLFRYNVNVLTGFINTFRDCYNLESVPEGLFRYNTSATDFSNVFYGCNKLQFNKWIFFSQGEENTRFVDISPNFSSAFHRTSFTGTPGDVPELWTCDYGTGTPNTTNCFSGDGNNLVSITNYCGIPENWGAIECPNIYNTSIIGISTTQLKIQVQTSLSMPVGDDLKCYFSKEQAGLVAPENLIPLNSVSDTVFDGVAALNDGEDYYLQVDYLEDGNIIETLSDNGTYYTVDQVETQTINVLAPNHLMMDVPRHSYNHGLIFHAGYIYGVARNIEYGGSGVWGTGLFKLKNDDYSVLNQIDLFTNKNAQAGVLTRLEQIVYCRGFLWCLSYGYLIRINPGDLDYMVFSEIDATTQGQPIGTDGTDLFVTTDTDVYKLDGSLMVDTFANYGYDGSQPVAIPPVAIIGNCAVIQKHPTENAYSHSIAIDSQNIYLALTSGANPTGYDSALDIYIFHFQRINKETMETTGDVTIPKCTDDMVQDGGYVFLAPEYPDSAIPIYGEDFGLLAINKNTLEIKYLRALHADFNTPNESDRQCYGVFQFAGKIVVQLTSSRKTVVVNTDNIESWGKNFPIGGATESIFQYQRDGVNVTYTPNELVIDNNGFAHVSTWGLYTEVLRFPIAELPGIDKTPNIQTSLLSSGSDSATLGGYIIDEGKSPMTAVGFRYGTDPLNLVNDVPVALAYDFQTVLNALDPGIYYFQAYGTNTEGTFYGNTVVFSTYNALSLSNTSAAALLEWINENYGCSIRCVQDAPGEADGTTGTATDQDGNVYNTVVINQKRWFVENLKTKHYRNGDPVPEVTDAGTWAALNSGGQSVYENDPKNL